jgi:hypothetical protein
MGWCSYTLRVKCEVLPEYVTFIKDNYLDKFHNITNMLYYDCDYGIYDEIDRERRDDLIKEFNTLPKIYTDLISIWDALGFATCFYKYEFDEENSIFYCERNEEEGMAKLHNKFKIFINNIIVPISYIIYECEIIDDDNPIANWGRIY